MKIIIALSFLVFSSIASAEFCTAVIKDQYSGYEYENYTRNSYSRDDACYQAMTDCHRALDNAQSQGRYQTAACVFVGYNPPPNQTLTCETDIIDQWNRIVRRFTATSYNAYDACSQSDQFCKVALSRNPAYGLRCVNRGIISGGGYPPPVITAECKSVRLDPGGNLVERYLGRATGPQNSDVYGAACNVAMNECVREIVGRQTCQLEH